MIPSSVAVETMVEATVAMVVMVVMEVGRRTVLKMWSLTAQWWNFGMCVCLER